MLNKFAPRKKTYQLLAKIKKKSALLSIESWLVTAIRILVMVYTIITTGLGCINPYIP